MKCDFCFCVPHPITDRSCLCVCVNKNPNPGSWMLLLRVEGQVSWWKTSADSGGLGFYPSSEPLPCSNPSFLSKNEMRKSTPCRHLYCSRATFYNKESLLATDQHDFFYLCAPDPSLVLEPGQRSGG